MGQYTALMHLVFIISQVIMLRKKFRPEYLLQIAAAAVFGLFTDLTLWAVGWIEAGSYIWKFVLMLLSCGITAVGISIEVRARAWMLAGEMTTATIADISGCKFRNVKIFFDSGLVIISALASLILFGNLLGKGELTVIREGTLVSAILTGYLMKFIDPYTERTFGKYLEKYEDNR